jgi:hypothetical protein
MKRPQRRQAPFASDQRAGVVGDAAHAARLTPAPSSTASAAASASEGSRPCSASHSATAINPSSTFTAFREASFSQAERLMPRRWAARLAASATGSSKETESFWTDIPSMVALDSYCTTGAGAASHAQRRLRALLLAAASVPGAFLAVCERVWDDVVDGRAGTPRTAAHTNASTVAVTELAAPPGMRPSQTFAPPLAKAPLSYRRR